MNKTLKILAWMVMIIPAIYLLVIWKKIPEIIPTHYNLKGEVDHFDHKSALWLMVGIITAVNAGVFLLLTNMHRIDPKRHALENKDKILRMAFAITVFMSAIICLLIYDSMLQKGQLILRFVFAGVGLLLSIIGNYMHTIKPNYFAGIRLPWTLENEENWRRTHQLGGRLFFAGGLLIAIVCLFVPLKPAMFISFSILLVITIIPMVYSYRIFKENKR